MTPDRLDVALFRGASAAELVPISMIEPWPDQPRRSIDDAQLLELAESIGKVGVLQPILVRPIRDGAMFGIVSGERRFRAARRATHRHEPESGPWTVMRRVDGRLVFVGERPTPEAVLALVRRAAKTTGAKP